MAPSNTIVMASPVSALPISFSEPLFPVSSPLGFSPLVPSSGVVRASAQETPLGFTPPIPMDEGMPPAPAGVGPIRPGPEGFTALAARVAEQASTAARLQEQLDAVLASGRRREEEAKQRQAENSASFQTLVDGMAALQAQQTAQMTAARAEQADQMQAMQKLVAQQGVLMAAMQAHMSQQVSALELSREKDKEAAAAREARRDAEFAALVSTTAEIDMRSRHPAMPSSVPSSSASGIYSEGGYRLRNGDKGRARHGP